MVEYIIKKAIIYAITFAIITAISSAVSNAVENAMAKSIENQLGELNLGDDEISEDLIKELIDIKVVSVANNYSITFEENIYGKFTTHFFARNKDDAIRTLGKKVLGFVNKNKVRLSEGELGFYLRIWFEMYMKENIVKDYHIYDQKFPYFLKDKNFYIQKVNWLIKKEDKLNKKIVHINNKLEFKSSKIAKYNHKKWKLNNNLVNINKEIEKQEYELKNLEENELLAKKHLLKLKIMISSPKFDISKPIIIVKDYQNSLNNLSLLLDNY